jgi:ribosomal protein S18 acetylase RimI-like enzyme
LAKLAAVKIKSLGYRTDVMVRALEGAQVTEQNGYVTIRSPGNPDFWWGNYLLLPESGLRDGPQRWIEQFTAEFPDATHLTMGADITGDDAGLAAFADAGLEISRETVLTAPGLHEPAHPAPAGEFRPLAGDADWLQAARLRDVCDAEEGPPRGRAFTDARHAARRTLAEGGHGAWFGTFLDGELAAQLGVISDGTGIARYQEVATHPDARRRGLAGALLGHAARYATSQLGATTLVIVADRDAAIRLYRSVGFTDHETQVAIYRPPADAG